jgi:hypothetical protein
MCSLLSDKAKGLLQRPLLLWTGLRGLGNSPAVKATILVPLVGYLIIFNQFFLDGFKQWEKLPTHFESLNTSSTHSVVGLLTSTQRLYLLYYGFTALAIGTLLFRACPEIIKENSSDAEFVARRKPLYSDHTLKLFLAELDQLLSWLNSAHHVVPQGEILLLQDELQAAKACRTPNKIKDQHLSQLMAIDFAVQNHMRPFWRLVTAIAFYSGLGMLLLPAVDMFIRVTATFFR